MSQKNGERPISLTRSINKVNEGFICKWIWDCIADKVNIDQYGGMRRIGTACMDQPSAQLVSSYQQTQKLYQDPSIGLYKNFQSC